MGRSLCLLLPLPETFHFHLRAGSVPCNLHLCSYSRAQVLASRAAAHGRASGALETRVGWGTEEQGRAIRSE